MSDAAGATIRFRTGTVVFVYTVQYDNELKAIYSIVTHGHALVINILDLRLNCGCLATTMAACDCPSHIVAYLNSRLGNKCVAHIEAAKSAQHRVLIVSLSNNVYPVDDPDWKQALERGNNKLVVRIWKGASRWWNLHQNHPSGTERLARSEVVGYRVAGFALKASATVRIPTVLYFSMEDERHSGESPWAITEYVGSSSSLFQETKLDSSWMDGMVKVRHEFGFDEPHPRWGRVPEPQALEYALLVLRSVIIPMHRSLIDVNVVETLRGINGLSGWQTGGIYYMTMASLYEDACKSLRQALTLQPDSKLSNAVDILHEAIQQLIQESIGRVINIPPVVVHIDLQPQNLLFAQNSKQQCTVASVLDWEEAACADPRFELLLLCRKVCANRAQADIVWETYQQACPYYNLGSIEPWLKLETVHSLTTLMLQSMNLLGGGRSPWETKPDLWGKIEREFARLNKAGWSFCDKPVH